MSHPLRQKIAEGLEVRDKRIAELEKALTEAIEIGYQLMPMLRADESDASKAAVGLIQSRMESLKTALHGQWYHGE